MNEEGPPSPIVLRGSCACGAVTWTSTSAATHLDFCYCIPCQQISGAPFAAWLGIPKAALDWQSASPPSTSTYTINPLATRSCCSVCGGAATIQYHCYPEKTHIAAGSVTYGAEETSEVGKAVPKVGCHLFVSRKPSWYTIPEDGVARWEEFDEEFDRVRREWEEERKKNGVQRCL
jgi:hypothetical protein